jgi:hypothetical protein
VVSIRNDKRTLTEIAKDYGVKFSTIYSIKKRKTWGYIPGGLAPVFRNGYSKLSPWQIPLIRKDPRNSKIISKEYGVAPGTIRHVKNRTKWKCIP